MSRNDFYWTGCANILREPMTAQLCASGKLKKASTSAAVKAGISYSDVAAVGLDTPGPATAAGVLSARGSTNFAHPKWAGFDIRGSLENLLGKPVTI